RHANADQVCVAELPKQRRRLVLRGGCGRGELISRDHVVDLDSANLRGNCAALTRSPLHSLVVVVDPEESVDVPRLRAQHDRAIVIADSDGSEVRIDEGADLLVVDRPIGRVRAKLPQKLTHLLLMWLWQPAERLEEFIENRDPKLVSQG